MLHIIKYNQKLIETNNGGSRDLTTALGTTTTLWGNIPSAKNCINSKLIPLVIIIRYKVY